MRIAADEGEHGRFVAGEVGDGSGDRRRRRRLAGGAGTPEITFEAARAPVIGADDFMAGDGDVDLANVTRRFAFDEERAAIVENGHSDAGAEGEHEQAAAKPCGL